MPQNEDAYQHGRDMAYKYAIPSEEILDWLEEEDTNQEGLIAWGMRGVLAQRSGVVSDEQGMLFSYE